MKFNKLEMSEAGLKDIRDIRKTLILGSIFASVLAILMIPGIGILMIPMTAVLSTISYLTMSYSIRGDEKELAIENETLKGISSKIGAFDNRKAFKTSYGYDVLTNDTLYSVFIKNGEILSIVKVSSNILNKD